VLPRSAVIVLPGGRGLLRGRGAGFVLPC